MSEEYDEGYVPIEHGPHIDGADDYYKQQLVTDGGNKKGAARALGVTILRACLVSPLLVTALALTITVVGAPIGVPLMFGLCAWATKPIRSHPVCNVKGDA